MERAAQVGELDWKDYLEVRASQGFTAVQWVATHWRGAPDDANGEKPFSGTEKISINPDYFKRLDQRVEMINRAGLVSVPVLFWAIDGEANPVHSLPDDQAILLGRYMAARWGGVCGAWILAGDGDYTGDRAARWKKSGRAFSGIDQKHRFSFTRKAKAGCSIRFVMKNG